MVPNKEPIFQKFLMDFAGQKGALEVIFEVRFSTTPGIFGKGNLISH